MVRAAFVRSLQRGAVRSFRKDGISVFHTERRFVVSGSACDLKMAARCKRHLKQTCALVSEHIRVRLGIHETLSGALFLFPSLSA